MQKGNATCGEWVSSLLKGQKHGGGLWPGGGCTVKPTGDPQCSMLINKTLKFHQKDIKLMNMYIKKINPNIGTDFGKKDILEKKWQEMSWFEMSSHYPTV